jgi:hypothetical protein
MQKKILYQINDRGFKKKGGDILSHITAVPSAQSDLTSLFGMGRGEPRRNNHLKRFCMGVVDNTTTIHNILTY